MKNLSWLLLGTFSLVVIIGAALYFQLVSVGGIVAAGVVIGGGGLFYYFNSKDQRTAGQPQNMTVFQACHAMNEMIRNNPDYQNVPQIDLEQQLVRWKPALFTDDFGKEKVHAKIIIAPKRGQHHHQFARWVYYVEWGDFMYEDDPDVLQTAIEEDIEHGADPFPHQLQKHKYGTFGPQKQQIPWMVPVQPQQDSVKVEEEE